jgi:hypothetical protein
MKSADRELILDVMAGSAAVLAFVAFIVLTQLYHGHHGLQVETVGPILYLLISWLVMAYLRWIGSRKIWRAAQVWMWVSLIVGLAVRYSGLLMHLKGLAITAVWSGLLFSFGLWASFKSSPSIWSGLRRIVAFLPALIVVSPVVAGYWLDAPIVWLSTDSIQQKHRTATIVLLLDEMNSKSALGLQNVLEKEGLSVNFKAVQAVHGLTVEAVPAIFSRKKFSGASPCGLDRICAADVALDFSQVSVERDDVDVVGFFHPYCAMQGLRSCQRITMTHDFWDLDRWKCTAKIYPGMTKEQGYKSCEERLNLSTVELREKVNTAMLDAPALKSGGVLYAHLPLPHPPSEGTGTLQDQYLRNVQKAEALLGQLIAKLRENNIEPRFLIYSDHPLRQALWCSTSSVNFDVPCVVKPDLVDDHVPLIVAARSNVPSIAHVQSNQQVFDVLREWLKH